MIQSKKELKEYLAADVKNYSSQNMGGVIHIIRNNLFRTPISEQKHIWKYIKEMRYVEYYEYKKKSCKLLIIPYLWHLHSLRKESHITGFQIPPGTCGKGLTIWHWGPIIINEKCRLGENSTLYPGDLIGHKKANEDAPIIGDNVFIGSGTKITGNITIGDNVTIAPNTVIFQDIPSNVVVAGNPARILKQK